MFIIIIIIIIIIIFAFSYILYLLLICLFSQELDKIVNGYIQNGVVPYNNTVTSYVTAN